MNHIQLLAIMFLIAMPPLFVANMWASIKLKSTPLPELRDTPEFREAIQLLVSIQRRILIAKINSEVENNAKD